ncbi:MAG: hypothetical protein Q9M91_04730 [Candidatus Dojkabacteria bacterium]|nr:hypothetical protein [Candidatus Dojkabacteria bacterium]
MREVNPYQFIGSEIIKIDSTHFYVLGDTNRDIVVNNSKIEGKWEGAFTYETIALNAFEYKDEKCPVGTVEVYRFRNNEYDSVHFYVIGTENRDTIIQRSAPNGLWANAFTYETVAFCVYSEENENSIPIYRFINNKLGGSTHFYVAGDINKDIIILRSKLGGLWEGAFSYENVAFHAVRNEEIESYDARREAYENIYPVIEDMYVREESKFDFRMDKEGKMDYWEQLNNYKSTLPLDSIINIGKASVKYPSDWSTISDPEYIYNDSSLVLIRRTGDIMYEPIIEISSSKPIYSEETCISYVQSGLNFINGEPGPRTPELGMITNFVDLGDNQVICIYFDNTFLRNYMSIISIHSNTSNGNAIKLDSFMKYKDQYNGDILSIIRNLIVL